MFSNEKDFHQYCLNCASAGVSCNGWNLHKFLSKTLSQYPHKEWVNTLGYLGLVAKVLFPSSTSSKSQASLWQRLKLLRSRLFLFLKG